MTLLFVFPYVPWPLDRGTFQRTYHLLREMARTHTIDFVALDENGESTPHLPLFEAFCREVEFIPFVHPPWSRLFPDRLLEPLPANVTHWRSPALAAAIDRRVAEKTYDLIHITDIVMAPYVLKHRDKVPFVMDRSRVDLQFQLMEHRTLKFPWRTRILRCEAYLKLWLFERKVARRTALEIVCGPDDETFLRRHVSAAMPIAVMVNGVNLEYFRPEAVPDPHDEKPTVIFCGAMDYNPNIDALDWYFREIHALVLAGVPELRVLIVGKNPVPAVQACASLPGVTVTGSVPDVRPCYRRAWVQMVPLRIGGGTRLKIVESLAMDIPVVSTTIGAQGLDLVHDENILLADSPADFAAQLIRGLTDPALRERLRAAGQTTVHARFGWPAIVQPLARRYEDLPRRAGSPASL
ncbi:MAG: glycosyltransferase family 4 protein [Verrucomicrobiota bacterium]